MAPPSIRRTGFSKRAQYTTFFGLLAAIAGALFGGLFLIVSSVDPTAFSGLRGLAADAAAPAGKAVAAGRDEGRSAITSINGFFMSGSRQASLEQEAKIARVRHAEAQALAEENRRLKALLGLPLDDGKPVATARLIASTPGSVRRFATLSAGYNQGLASGMPVRSPLGLVGRVLEVSHSTARVLLITDSASMVPVRRASDGVAAFAQGHGDGTLQIHLNNLGLNPLKPGDVFVTSGSGGLFRPGVAVAVVVALTRDGAIARVLSDPSVSEFVVVEAVFAPGVAAPPAASSPQNQPKPKPQVIPSQGAR